MLLSYSGAHAGACYEQARSECRTKIGPDQRTVDELGRKPRDIYILDLRFGSGIKVPTRTFGELIDQFHPA